MRVGVSRWVPVHVREVQEVSARSGDEGHSVSLLAKGLLSSNTDLRQTAKPRKSEATRRAERDADERRRRRWSLKLAVFAPSVRVRSAQAALAQAGGADPGAEEDGAMLLGTALAWSGSQLDLVYGGALAEGALWP